MHTTKDLLSDAMWKLLELKSYNKITVNDIVDECDLNRNTFYYHFPNIPTLLEFSIKKWANEIIQSNFKFSSPVSCLEAIVAACNQLKDPIINIYHSEHREIFMANLTEVIRHFVSIYISEIEDRFETDSEKADTLSYFYRCFFTGVFIDWFNHNMDYDLIALFSKLNEFFVLSNEEIILDSIDTTEELEDRE